MLWDRMERTTVSYEKIDSEHYYDGHYIDSDKSQKEREEDERLAKEDNKKYTDWSEIDH